MAKGCSGKSFEGGSEVDISDSHAVGSAYVSSQSTQSVAAGEPAPRTPESCKRDLAIAVESPVKGLAPGVATRMTHEEQLAATKASADEAIKPAAKSKGIGHTFVTGLLGLPDR